MKTIYFIRHAKSSWESPISDFERPLSSRGVKDAHLIGEALKDKNIIVSKIFSSTAKRAQTTAKIITFKLGINEETIEYNQSLYDFSGTQVLHFIKHLPNTLKSILVFGHNPAFTNLVSTLSNRKFENIPTCGVVGIQFNSEHWKQLTQGEIIVHLFPNTLK